ncbi:MAG: hypothetical protein ABIG42_09320 [bacterium]
MFKYLLYFILALSIVCTGCSNSNPVTSVNSPDATGFEQPNDLPVYRTGSMTYDGIIGAFSVVIDPETLTGELLPLRRTNALGDSFDSHITEFMLKNPCSDCLKIGGIALTIDENIAVDFMIKHPFGDLQLRPDLHVFDVRGIILVPGGITFGMIQSDVDGDGNASEAIQTNPHFLLNANGYTTHFDDATLGDYFDPPLNYAGNLNPFKNFFINPSSGSFDPFQATGHNVMKVGSDWDRQRYVFESPVVGDLEFSFIVDASYGQSAIRFTRQNPQYYLPEFNRKEAWEVTVETFNDTLEEAQVSSTASIRVIVKDWQAQRNRDVNFPDSNNLLGLKEKSDLEQIEIHCPDFGYFDIKTRLEAEAGGNGTNSAPYVFTFGGPGKIETGVLTTGTYYGLVAVRDDLNGLGGPLPIKHGSGEEYPSNGPDILDYTAYQIIELEVRSPGSIGCPSTIIAFSGCNYTSAFGAEQNPYDTVVGVSGSPANILDIDYGTTAPWGQERFALELAGILGVAFDAGTPGGFLAFIPGQPGFRVGSIDVDQQERLVWSGSDIGFTPGVVTVTDRNANATDTFQVWLLNPLPAQIAAVVDLDPTDTNGKKVIAIDTDSNDDVWLIDSDNYLHKYLAGENYTEDLSSGFDLTDAFPPLPSPDAFQGEVFDFVINYHNKSLYILTDFHTNCSLYRIECNGTYYSSYGGLNPNPLHGVLVGPHGGLADISIDNFNETRNILLGQQDCEMIIGGGNVDAPGPDNLYLTRLNAVMSNPRYLIRQNGCQAMALDPINDMLRVVHGSSAGNEYFSTHQEPVDFWY